MNQDNILVMKSITKSFPGVKALDEVNIQVKRGEIHFIVGENGAGKSTLMKVLSGIYPHGNYDGDIIFDGEIKHFHNIKQSVRDGIIIINQELALFPNLTVYENVFVGHERANNSIMDWDATKREAKKYLDMVGLDVDIYRLAGSLGVGKQQLIEIAKALSQNVKLLILDEPTAALNEDDSENLLRLLVELKKQGITSIMISHKLKEVEAVADSLTVLRDGKTIIRMDAENINEAEIIKNMVGREIDDIYPKRPKYKKGGEVVLETIHLNSFDKGLNRYIVNDANIKLHKGEVVGLAGLMGAGRTELAHSIFGNPKKYKLSGKVIAYGKPVNMTHPRHAIDLGIAYVSEDRKQDGLILDETIAQNITISDLKKISNSGVIDFFKQNQYAEQLSKEIDIRTPSILQDVKNLSGGNQQKVQVAKWLFSSPKILILDEPTRGIDVGAKYEIYTIVNDLVARGMSILIISSELPEILGMCDRVYVIAEGIQTAEFDIEDATAEKIMESATV